MTTEQLQCFFQAVEQKSFTKAAQALYMSQPALSKRIDALETELGFKLFKRSKSAQIELTPSGTIIYEGFRDLEKERYRIIREAKKQLEGTGGMLRLGIYEEQLVDEKMRMLLDGFSEAYPSIELIITTDSFNGLHAQLKEGRMDAAITLGYDALRRKDMSSLELYKIPVLLVVPNQFLSRLSATEHLSDFAQLPFLSISSESNVFQDEVLRKHTGNAGFTPNVIMAQDEKNFIMLLEMGKGIAPLDRFHKCCSSSNVTCFDLPELPPCELYLTWNPKWRSPALQSLISYCEKNIRLI